MAKAKKFSEKDVEVLTGLQPIRKKPGMYVSEVTSYGLMVILREPLDNVVDEFESGRASQVLVKFKKDGSIEIHDDGQGMPVGKHKTEKVSTLQVLTGMLHAGGKLGGGEAYNNSRGCLLGTTRILLSDMSTIRIDEMYKNIKNGARYEVLSVGHDGYIYKSPVQDCQLTKTVHDIKLVSVNGSEFFGCTIDHPFLTPNNKKHIAKDNMSLVHLSLEGIQNCLEELETYKAPELQDMLFCSYDEALKQFKQFLPELSDSNDSENIKYIESVVGCHLVLCLGGYIDVPEVVKLFKQARENLYKNGRLVVKNGLTELTYDYYEEFLNEFCDIDKFMYTDLDEATIYERRCALYKTLINKPEIELPRSSITVENSNSSFEMPVYDITVPIHHNFILANGLVSGNTFGVGIKATNALSEMFRVVSIRDKQYYEIEYSKGELVQETHKIKPIKRPFKTGTSIYFKPDMTIFEKGSKINMEDLETWADTASYFSPGFKVTIDTSEVGGEVTEYLQEEGLDGWISAIVEDLDAKFLDYEDNILIQGRHFDLAIGFTNAEGNNIDGYCNGLYQGDGGNHVEFIGKTIYDEISSKAKKSEKFDKDSLLDGIVGVVNFKIDSPRFTGQTKDKLRDTRFEELCSAEIEQGIKKYFSKNKALVSQLISRACDLAALKADFKADKKATKALNDTKKRANVYNAKICRAESEVPYNEREVFLVEGDSAGGSARLIRYPNQTVLPLKGKIVNTLKSSPDKFMQNEEILLILAAIGYDPNAKDPIKNLECGKIVLLSDSDNDGCHINTLELTALYTICPKIFDAGIVYTVLGPRYQCSYNNQYYTAMTVEEMKSKLPKNADLSKISYLKGWGEVEPNLLKDIAFTKGSRQLIKILPPSKSDCKEFELLMGESENNSYRKKMFNLL